LTNSSFYPDSASFDDNAEPPRTTTVDLGVHLVVVDVVEEAEDVGVDVAVVVDATSGRK